MRFAFALSVLAAAFVVLALTLARPSPASIAAATLAAWAALAAAVVAAGYAGAGAGVFGKGRDGRRATWARLLLLPYFGGVALARWLQRTVTGERPYDEVAPGLYVGRRVPTHALPADVRLVVDLTAELTEPAATRRSYQYRCLPTLDGMAPAADELRALCAEVAAYPEPVYIHCAAGHGRAAMFASVVLVKRGLAPDVRVAERQMRGRRPKVRMTRLQRRRASEAARASASPQ